jgi:hypothetical protein
MVIFIDILLQLTSHRWSKRLERKPICNKLTCKSYDYCFVDLSSYMSDNFSIKLDVDTKLW